MNLKEELKEGETGVFHLSGGEIGYSTGYWMGDMFALRYESGWYVAYTNDGIRPVAGIIRHVDGTEEEVPGGDKRNIVQFERMDWDEALAKYKEKLSWGFHP